MLQPGWPRSPPPRRPPAPATTPGAFPLRGRAPRRTPPLPPPPSLHPWWPRTLQRARVATTDSRLFPIRGHEPEPDAPHGVEQLELRGLLQFAAKIAHMDVHHVALGVEVEIPHLFEQLGAPDHFLRPEQEMLEQLEFLRRELELLPLDFDLVLQAIEFDRPIAEELGAACAATPDQRSHAGQELVELERLGEIIVGAGVEPAHHVLRGVPCGEHQDRRLASFAP